MLCLDRPSRLPWAPWIYETEEKQKQWTALIKSQSLSKQNISEFSLDTWLFRDSSGPLSQCGWHTQKQGEKTEVYMSVKNQSKIDVVSELVSMPAWRLSISLLITAVTILPIIVASLCMDCSNILSQRFIYCIWYINYKK